jgi:hypothetical protein
MTGKWAMTFSIDTTKTLHPPCFRYPTRALHASRSLSYGSRRPDTPVRSVELDASGSEARAPMTTAVTQSNCRRAQGMLKD